MKKYEYNKNVFKNINTEEEAYWLGFILADGCNIGNKNLRVNIKDKGHLEKLSKLIYIDEKPISITDHGFGPIYYFSCTKKEIINNLNNYGVVPRKSKIAKFPIIKEHLYRHFIRGLFDGDGSICYTMDKNYRRYQFSIVGTEQLMKKIYDIFLKGNYE